MSNKIEDISSILSKYPAAHRTARQAYFAARTVYRPLYTAQAIARRPYQIREYLRNPGNFTGLQIGSASHQLDGWLATDFDPDLKHVYMDATKRFPFANGTFNYIVAEHFIEHIPYIDGLKMLRECHRVLKTGGVVRIATPDIQLTHKLLHAPLTPELESYVLWSNRTFGSADGGAENVTSAIHVVNRLQHEWGHQFLYDQDTLAASLRKVGFTETAECSPSKSEHPALTNIDLHLRGMGEEANELESLIVEATK